MNREEILTKINEVFRYVLDDEELILNESTTASDVEGWDSLTHIQLVVAVEKQFNIRFTSREIQQWNHVGDLITSVESKL